jgi:tRNA-splicing ligase RtcB
VKIFGQHEAGTLAQFEDVRSRAVDAALMADGHYGYVSRWAASRPTATRRRWWASGSTSRAATPPSGPTAPGRPRRHPGAQHAASRPRRRGAPHGELRRGRKNAADDAPVDDPLFEDPAWRAVPGSKKEANALKQKARAQLGTVGSGNHYVDVFADEGGGLWVGVHFGSRGFGHAVASMFMAMGQGSAGTSASPSARCCSTSTRR